MRSWIDRKNRGKKNVEGCFENGLAVPSLVAFNFFKRLDSIIESFEGTNDLTMSLNFDAVMSKAYDDLTLLDAWQTLTTDLEEAHQHVFLEFAVNVFR